MTKLEIKACRASYVSEFTSCQYTPLIRMHVSIPVHFKSELELEHIWNKNSPKYQEHWSNYAMASPGAHVWKHENSDLARIVITWFKWRLSVVSDDGRHFDREHIKSMTGQDPIGWVANKVDELMNAPDRRGVKRLPEWVKTYASDLLSGNGVPMREAVST